MNIVAKKVWILDHLDDESVLEDEDEELEQHLKSKQNGFTRTNPTSAPNNKRSGPQQQRVTFSCDDCQYISAQGKIN